MHAAAVRHGPARCRRKREGATQFPTIGLFERNANNFKGTRNTKAQKSWSSRADRKFESTSLQQTVCLSPAVVFEGRETRLSARVCAAGLATGSAETRRVFRYRANRQQYLCRAIFQYRSAADVVARLPRRSQRSRPFSGLNVGSSLNSDRAQPKPSMVR